MCGSSNQCFLCLSELPKIVRSRGRPKKVQAPSELTFKYLLQTQDNRYDNILQAVSLSLSSSSVQFCETCQDSLSKISDLHLKLEVIQLKLIDRLKSVREIIIKATSSRPDEKVLGDRTKQSALQESFETLVLFQNAVAEGSHKPIHIPFVLLERCTNFKHLSPPSSALPSNVRETVEPSVNVKLEANQEYETEIFPFDDDNHAEVDPCFMPDIELEESETKVDIRSGVANHAISAKVSTTTRVTTTKIATRRRRKRKWTPTSRRSSSSKIKKVKKIKRALIYICDICQYQVSNKHIPRFEHHLRTHETPEKVYKCSKCPTHEGFSGKQLYEFHLSFHNKLNGNRCDICRRKFDPTELPKHLLTHTGVDTIFQCQSCSYCGTSEEKFLEHISKFHPGVNLVCYICSEKFTSQKKLNSHLHDAHQKLEKKVCDVDGCGKEFFNQHRLSTHKTVAHSGQTYICHECGKVCSNASALKVHQANHTETKFFVCDEPGCPESFGSTDGLYAHKIREHGAPKLKCEQCDKDYTTPESLKLHVESQHEGKIFPCEYCGKIMNHKKTWQRHLLRHTDPEKLTCKVCGKRFTLMKVLKDHMLTHIGDRNFQCTYCSKAFVVEKYLKQHLRLHTGEKAYMCHHCGKAFSQPAGLYLHKKSQHKDVDITRK